jgi:hypothetical protein
VASALTDPTIEVMAGNGCDHQMKHPYGNSHIPLVEQFVVELLNSLLDPLHNLHFLHFDDSSLDEITIMGLLGFLVEVSVRVLKTGDLHRLLFE